MTYTHRYECGRFVFEESVEFLQSFNNLLVQVKVETAAITVAEMQQGNKDEQTLHHAHCLFLSCNFLCVPQSVNGDVLSLYT